MGQINSNTRNNNIFRRRGTTDNANARYTEEGLEIENFQPKSDGTVFGSHFLMGGGIYESIKHDNFLFGDLVDLEHVGSKPTHFPYEIQPGPDTIATLNTLVNIRRNSICFGKKKDKNNSDVSVEFIFDCDSPCYVQIHFHAKENIDGLALSIMYEKNEIMSSKKFYFDTGSNILFNQFSFKPDDYNLIPVGKNFNENGETNDNSSSPFSQVVIEIRSTGEKNEISHNEHAQLTFCNIVKSNDKNSFLMLKPQRQKLFVDGVLYLLQEVYGIENKEYETSMIDENGSECIICMSDIRDTVILPCRHLCICNNCAETLRYKQNNCPICRSPFRALLQMKTCRVIGNGNSNEGQCNGRVKYEIQTLIESLNGINSSMSHNKQHLPKLGSTSVENDKDNENNILTNHNELKISSTDNNSCRKLQEVLKANNTTEVSVIVEEEEIELHDLDNNIVKIIKEEINKEDENKNKEKIKDDNSNE
ncbi:Zinc finger, RING-type domain and Zinc finger, RING/FYVE/PHD-type domain-containing protein [Strongyloides ratti]|uniref:RING-type E3 ubiquitin transferase n=1 Tax=Strongyloides ratti TaxID=34506 RepID=A0A090KYA7_STRRB|nr:Zinc finger, RING-type domain and Zinc finger, RING/FYVE/PHD-type domain-containing protein [Strongyloides ratti]CEF60857.1 Zinc finger, RING-type domain and Zinc finger, RING/FYVE/PHD-type domain-containing protein [Strongyloides ratti]